MSPIPLQRLMCIAVLFTAIVTMALAQDRPHARPGAPETDGPWNRDVIVYRVSPAGDVERAATFERAGVPTVARLNDGRLIAAHQHFPQDAPADFDKVAVRFSSDDGRTWTAPRTIQLTGLPEGMRFPFDPTLVPLPDGQIRLYFTSNQRGPGGTPAIYSAVSGDGVAYTVEPGIRFGIDGRPVIDCAVVLHQGIFHLYAPDNGVATRDPGQMRSVDGVGYHATSRDGLAFTREPDVQIPGRRRWLGNAQSDGGQITFYGTGDSMGENGRPRGSLWTATSADGRTWSLTDALAIPGGDPGAVATRDGGLLVVITGERVRNTPRPAMPAPPAADRPLFLTLPRD